MSKNLNYTADKINETLANAIGDHENLNVIGSKVGDLSDLETTDKSSLVNAINEVASSGGGGSITIDTAMSDTSSHAVQNKVIKAYADTKQDNMLDATSIASGLVDNTKYTLGEITALDLTTIPTDNSKGILIYFSTGTSGCTLTYSANTNWLGSDAPSVEASKNYVILIADNVCGINEYEPQTLS